MRYGKPVFSIPTIIGYSLGYFLIIIFMQYGEEIQYSIIDKYPGFPGDLSVVNVVCAGLLMLLGVTEDLWKNLNRLGNTFEIKNLVHKAMFVIDPIVTIGCVFTPINYIVLSVWIIITIAYSFSRLKKVAQKMDVNDKWETMLMAVIILAGVLVTAFFLSFINGDWDGVYVNYFPDWWNRFVILAEGCQLYIIIRARALWDSGIRNSTPVTLSSCALSVANNQIPVNQELPKTANMSGLFSYANGLHHDVSLNLDGTVRTTGSNERGQCNTDEWSDIAGSYYTAGLKRNGTVVIAGSKVDGLGEAEEWKHIVGIACGNNHIIGLTSDGLVMSAGANYNGQCNVGEWNDIKFVFAEDNCSYGLKCQGDIVFAGKYSGKSEDDIIEIYRQNSTSVTSPSFDEPDSERLKQAVSLGKSETLTSSNKYEESSSPSKSGYMFCRKCGVKILADCEFCPKCGQRII